MSAQALCRREKRIQKDIASVRALSLKENGVFVDSTTFSEPEWAVFVQGPVESVWGGGVFKLKMSFPQGYPFDPIKINFAHGIFHPNVGSGGTICLDIIKKDAWSPSYTLTAVFQSIRSLLSDPNPDSPMNGDSARLFKSNKGAYEKKVLETVARWGQEMSTLPRQTLHSEKADKASLERLKRDEAEKASSSRAKAVEVVEGSGSGTEQVSTTEAENLEYYEGAATEGLDDSVVNQKRKRDTESVNNSPLLGGSKRGRRADGPSKGTVVPVEGTRENPIELSDSE